MKTSIFFLFTLVLLSGCKDPPNPTPEMSDPVYLDFADKFNAENTLRIMNERMVDTALMDYRTAKPQTGKIKTKRKEYIKKLKTIKMHAQKELFYSRRMEARKIWVRKAYLHAYKNDLPWPNTKNLERYKQMEALRNASRRWSDRVPKLADRIEKMTGKRP